MRLIFLILFYFSSKFIIEFQVFSIKFQGLTLD